MTHCRYLRTHRYPPSAQQEGPPPPPTGKASPGQDMCPCGVRTPPQDHLQSPGTPPPPTGPRAHVPATPLRYILLRRGQAIGVTPLGWLVAGAWRSDGAAVGLTVHRQLAGRGGAVATDGAGPSCPDTRFGPRTQESKLMDQVPVRTQGSGGSGRTPCGAVAAPWPAAGPLLGLAGLCAQAASWPRRHLQANMAHSTRPPGCGLPEAGPGQGTHHYRLWSTHLRAPALAAQALPPRVSAFTWGRWGGGSSSPPHPAQGCLAAERPQEHPCGQSGMAGMT